MPVHVAIAEDNALALKMVMEKLSSVTDIKVKFAAHHGEELLQKVAQDSNLDIVLMDIEMPVMGGIETTRQLKQKFPHIRVVMLTTFDDDEKIFESIMAGASGYLLKEENGANIYKAICEIRDGGAPMSAGIALKVLNLVRKPLQASPPKEDFKLTTREIELLEQLKNGLTYDEIAANLVISNGTVRKHIENIYRKLQVNNKVEAVQKATQHRIV